MGESAGEAEQKASPAAAALLDNRQRLHTESNLVLVRIPKKHEAGVSKTSKNNRVRDPASRQNKYEDMVEYELCRDEDGEGLPGRASSQEVLDWWFSRKATYLMLFKTACIYLVVPASLICRVREGVQHCRPYRDQAAQQAGNGDGGHADIFSLYRCHGVGWKMGETRK